MDMSYCFYMAESEGLLPTRAGKINAVIKDVKAYPSPTIELSAFKRILSKHGLKYSELSKREINYINSMIR